MYSDCITNNSYHYDITKLLLQVTPNTNTNLIIFFRNKVCNYLYHVVYGDIGHKYIICIEFQLKTSMIIVGFFVTLY